MSRSIDLPRFRCWLLLLVAVACDDAGPSSDTPPATIQHAVSEAELTTVTLTSDAVQRLGIETAPVESATFAPTREVGGEIIVPPGFALTVVAPVPGMVLAPEGGSIPRAGARVADGQTLFRLVGLPAGGALARTREDLVVAEARLRAARAEAERTANLFADRLVSARDNERAIADLAAALADRDAVAAQRRLADGGRGATPESSPASSLAIAAPQSGVLQTLHVAAGQVVAAGASLAEIVRLDRLWVRVPIYAGDAGKLRRGEDAAVHALSAASSNATRAVPVSAPPSADASSASIDLFYEVRGSTAALRPGQRVGVTIPIEGARERALGIPLDARGRDMSGGAWVYDRLDSLVFARRRVDVVRVVNGRAILGRGPAPGAPVVIAGAAELFGTEFGAGK